MNKQWRQELEKMTLTDEQKKLLKKQVIIHQKSPNKKSINWTFIVAPVFLILLVICTMLLLTDKPLDMQIHQASKPTQEIIELDHTLYYQKHIRLSLFSGTLIVLNGYVVLLTIMKTVRWQQPKMIKWRNTLKKWRYLLLISIPLFLVLSAFFIAFCLQSEFAKMLGIYSLVNLFIWLIILLSAHKKSGKVCCPHCQHELSAMEKRKLMLYFKMELFCNHCGGKLYYAKQTRVASGGISFVMLACIIFPTTFGIPFWITIVCGLLLYATVLYYLFPLFLQLDGEDKAIY